MSFGNTLDLIRRMVDIGVMPTAVIGIVDRTGIRELEAFGRVNGRESVVEDRYPIFSVTKPIVAMSALRAVERGLVGLDASLRTAVPEFGRGRPDDVQLHHLLTHTSGIGEPPLHTPDGLRPTLIRAGMDFPAGTVSRYSSIAFEGVRAIYEHATARTLESEVRDIAVAVGATSLSFDDDADTVRPIETVENGLDYPMMQALRHPGAGLYGSAADLLAVAQSLLRDDGAIIHPVTLAGALRSRTSGVPRLESYPAEREQDSGLGWNLLTRAPGLLHRHVYGHGGWGGTEFWMFPSLGVAVILQANRPSLAERGLLLSQLLNTVATGVGHSQDVR